MKNFCLNMRRAVEQREGASILLLPVAKQIHPFFLHRAHQALNARNSSELLYEFKDLDLPNGVRDVASFVLGLLQSKGLESRVITKRGDLIAATGI
jgi:hypothetical protein